MKRALLPLIVVLAVFGIVQIAAASVINVGDQASVALWPYAPSDQAEGPFVVRDLNTGYSALTFCVQQNNYFWGTDTGSTFTVGNLSSAATTYNTSGGTVAVKQLSDYGAWVDDQFNRLALHYGISVNGILSSAPTGLTWGQVFNAYQEAIWAGMVGPTGTVGGGDSELYTTSSYSNIHDTGNLSTDTAIFHTLGIDYYDFLTASPAPTPAATVINFDPYYDSGYEMGQNQVVPILLPGGQGTARPVPEPATLLIWGLGGLGAAGAMAASRRKQPRGRWSEENRRAIYDIVEGKR
jgi:hypothetical protein